MILLCGVTGRVGGSAARYLLDQGVKVRGLVRDVEKAADLRDRGMELISGDLLDSDSVQRAMEGVSSALLVTGNNEQQLKMECGFASAAALAGVGHLVKISSMEAGPEAQAPFPVIHYKAEQFIKSLGLRSTILRPNFFSQNLLMSAQGIAQANMFTLPLGKAKTGLLDAREVGEIAGRVLLQPGKGSQNHMLTGPELMDFHEVAARMSTVLGREITYVEQSAEAFRAFLEKVIPVPWHVNAVCLLFEEIANHSLEVLTSDSADLLGREPAKIEQFVQDFRPAFG